jgi:enoyl-CoA hydratase/carnithine racemase
MEKSEFNTLITEVTDFIGRVALNRPECLNAMNDALMNELLEVGERLMDGPLQRTSSGV